jgi:cbb3-type cytochrome oxidase cytochrome c subunit
MKLRAGEWLVLAGSGGIVALAALVGTVVLRQAPPVQYAYQESALSRSGEAIYRREGCGACHQVFGNGATYGPSLDGEGARRSRDWLQAYLVDPRPGVGARPYRVRMPSYGGMPQRERDALVAYLLALRPPGAQPL